jgi:hypothetical protein
VEVAANEAVFELSCARSVSQARRVFFWRFAIPLLSGAGIITPARPLVFSIEIRLILPP